MIKGIFLGTGSIPTKERNSQGVLLEFDNKETVLIDCGEGIQRQILNIDTDLEKLNTIFLTHDHIDHIYGVGGMLTLLLSRYPKKKVIIYGPKVTVKTVKEVVNLFMPEKISRIKYIETTGSQEIRTESYDCYTFKTRAIA
ncbi:MBL fold metallo-hydrolase [Dethiothermospora halolimnae]|uniref:MBL fold metallo-hydrolase n=1 Tax=Dethiothermospora halolimnae TaxID=3114390 RepID=UPI003CCBB212